MGYVYVIRARGTIHCKIGATNGSVDARLQKLQTGNPYALEVVRAYRVQDAFRVEHALHRYFSFCRGNGEWFEMRNVTAIDKAMRSISADGSIHSVVFSFGSWLENMSYQYQNFLGYFSKITSFIGGTGSQQRGNLYSQPKRKKPKLGKTYYD